MIPKKIHYCWLGKHEKSELVRRCMKSWEKYAPDYEIVEWNEETFPFEKVDCQYMQEAIAAEKWAFVTDYMRLYVLVQEGGVYLDTDVELCQSLDSFLTDSSFLGFESKYSVCTAVIGAEKDTEWIKDILRKYEQRKFILANGKFDQTPNTKFIMQILKKQYGLQENNGMHQQLACGLHVYPGDYFSPKNYATMQMHITENTHAIHHYNATWKSSKSRKKDQLTALLARAIGEEAVEKLKKVVKRDRK